MRSGNKLIGAMFSSFLIELVLGVLFFDYDVYGSENLAFLWFYIAFYSRLALIMWRRAWEYITGSKERMWYCCYVAFLSICQLRFASVLCECDGA